MSSSPTAPSAILTSLGLDRLLNEPAVTAPNEGVLADDAGARLSLATPTALRAFRYVLEQDSPGTWAEVLKSSGRTSGQGVALRLEQELARQGQPALAALPLEACLALLERHFALHGIGRMSLDLAAAADHGLVLARLEHSVFVAALADAAEPVDPFPAGILEGFFHHLTGEPLGCVEIGCAAQGAPQCTFVITAADRLAAVQPLIGVESTDAILARLKS